MQNRKITNPITKNFKKPRKNPNLTKSLTIFNIKPLAVRKILLIFALGIQNEGFFNNMFNLKCKKKW